MMSQRSTQTSDFRKPLTSAIDIFLWRKYLPKYFQCFFLCVSHLQYLLILLWSQFEFITSSSQSETPSILHHITETLVRGTTLLLPGSNEVLILISLYLMAFILFIVFMGYKFIENKVISDNERFTIFLFSQTHLNIIFWIINATLVSFYIKPEIDQGANNSSTKRIISFILLSINGLIGFILSFFSYDPFKGLNVLSIHSPIFQVHTFILKCTATVFLLIDTLNWYIALILLLLSIVRHYNMYSTVPYYEYIPMRISTILSACSMAFSLLIFVFTLIKLSEDISEETIIFVEVLVTLFILKFCDNQLQRTAINYLTKNDLLLKTQDDVFKKQFALNYMVYNAQLTLANQSNLNYKDIQVWGSLCDELTKSSPSTGHHHKNSNLMDSIRDLKKKYTTIVETQSYYLLRNSIARLKSCDKLKIALANFVAQQNTNLSIGIMFLLEIRENKRFNKILAARVFENLKQKVNKSFIDQEGGTFNVKTFVEFETLSKDFIEMIHSNSCRVVEFWKLYQQPTLETMLLLRQSRIIETEDDKIKDFWTTQIEKHKSLASSLKFIYSIYLALVRNTPHAANQLKEKYKLTHAYRVSAARDYGPLTAKTMASPLNITLHVSLARDRIGNIIYVSPNVRDLTRWSNIDITNKNINILLSPFMREKHDEILINHLERPQKSTRLHRNISSFIQDKEGYILPCYVYLSIYPHIQDELLYLGVVRVPEKYNDRIVLSQDGFIEGFTKTIGEKLGIPLRKKTHIRQFCINFEEIDIFEENSSVMVHDLKQIALKFSRFDPLRPLEEETVSYLCELVPQVYYHTRFYTLQLLTDLSSPDYHKYRKHPETGTHKRLSEQSPKHNNPQSPSEASVHKHDLIGESAARKSSSHLLDVRTYGMDSQPQNLIPTLTSNPRRFSPDSSRIPLSPNLTSVEMSLDANIKSPLRIQIVKKSKQQIASINAPPNSTTTSTLRSINSTSEEAVYKISKQSKTRNLNIAFIFFMIFNCVILGYFHAQSKGIINDVSGEVETVSDLTTQLLQYLELNRLFRNFVLYDENIFSDDRLANAGIPSLTTYSTSQAYNVTQQMNEVNSKVRRNIFDIDEKLAERIYSKFEIFDWNTNNELLKSGSVDLFEFGVNIVAESQKETSNPSHTVSQNDPDLTLILKNTLDDVLNYGESGIEMTTKDSQDKLIQIRTSLFWIASSAAAFGLAVIYFFLSLKLAFIKDRNRLIFIFKRLDERVIKVRALQIEDFCHILEKNDMDSRKLNLKLRAEKFDAVENISKAGQIQSKKSENRKDLNQGLTKITVLVLLFTLLIYSAYIIIFIILLTQNQQTSKNIVTFENSNLEFYRIFLVFISLYEYIENKATTSLKGNPIKDEWEFQYGQITGTQYDLISLLEQDSGFMTLAALIHGDLCLELEAPIDIANNCPTLLKGALTKGIIFVNEFFTSTISRIKTTFDASSMGSTDILDAFNDSDLIECESIVSSYLIPAYEAINIELMDQIKQRLGTYSDRITIVIVFYLVFYICIGPLLWFKIIKAYEFKCNAWRKLIRLIPGTLIANDQMIKSYINVDKGTTSWQYY